MTGDKFDEQISELNNQLIAKSLAREKQGAKIDRVSGKDLTDALKEESKLRGEVDEIAKNIRLIRERQREHQKAAQKAIQEAEDQRKDGLECEVDRQVVAKEIVCPTCQGPLTVRKSEVSRPGYRTTPTNTTNGWKNFWIPILCATCGTMDRLYPDRPEELEESEPEPKRKRISGKEA